MKIEGKTIPAPQNIKRREAYLLQHADKLPKTYVQAQLLKIAMIRSEKRLRWQTPVKMQTMEEREARMKETAKTFEVVKPKPSFFKRVTNIFKSQRSQ